MGWSAKPFIRSLNYKKYHCEQILVLVHLMHYTDNRGYGMGIVIRLPAIPASCEKVELAGV